MQEKGLQVAKKRGVVRYPKASRQMAVERLKSCDSVTASAEEPGMFAGAFLQAAGPARADQGRARSGGELAGTRTAAAGSTPAQGFSQD
jgi:hypothetical protein